MSERETDYKQFERERMISLTDLIEEVLRRIWLVIVLAVVCAVVCAGWKYMSDRSGAESSVGTDSYAKAVSSLSEKEMSEVNSVLALYDEAAAEERYLEESTLMSVDPYHEKRVSMQFELQAQTESLVNVLQAMELYVTGGGLAADIQADLYPDRDGAYLTELFSVRQGSFSADSQTVLTEETADESSAMFSLQVIGSSAEEAADLADAAELCLDTYAEKLADHFGTCRLLYVNRSAVEIYDSGLRSTQNSLVSDLISLQSKINTQTAALSDKQAEVLEGALAGEADSDTADSAPAQTTKVHISRRYVLVGLLIGIVLGILLIALYYIFRGTLNVAQELPGELGIPLFGQLDMKRQRNPLVRGWRRLVYKRKTIPLETQTRIVLANLRNFCHSHGVERILLAGSRPDLSENASLKELREALARDSIEAEIAGGLPDSPETLEKLKDYSHVAVVETLHRSYYRNVLREVEICEDQNVRIIGAIVLD